MARKASKGIGNRTIGLAVLGTLVGAGAAAFAAFKFRKPGNAEHEAPDLALDAAGSAPDAFRPDVTAPVPANEREGLRPVTTPVPSPVDRESVTLS